jgi:hypothetical protein
MMILSAKLIIMNMNSRATIIHAPLSGFWSAMKLSPIVAILSAPAFGHPASRSSSRAMLSW